jgi:hypothetical protein
MHEEIAPLVRVLPAHASRALNLTHAFALTGAIRLGIDLAHHGSDALGWRGKSE